MSDANQSDGKQCYADGDTETRQWFHRQWVMWPDRADKTRTTNISFHYGGVLAFREAHGSEPLCSQDLQSHVAWLDANSPQPLEVVS